MKKYGYLREDNNGHWYLIPEDKVKHFVWIKEKIDMFELWSDDWEDACQDMIDHFDGYRISGGPYDLKIQMENKDE